MLIFWACTQDALCFVHKYLFKYIEFKKFTLFFFFTQANRIDAMRRKMMQTVALSRHFHIGQKNQSLNVTTPKYKYFFPRLLCIFFLNFLGTAVVAVVSIQFIPYVYKFWPQKNTVASIWAVACACIYTAYFANNECSDRNKFPIIWNRLMTFILEYNSILTRNNPKCVGVCVCAWARVWLRVYDCVYKLRGRIT